MKKFTKFLILPALILCSMVTLFACGGKPEGIKIISTFKTEYYVGENLDVTGGIIEYTKDKNTIHIAIEEEMITGFSSETEGTRNMVLSYIDNQTDQIYTLKIAYTIKAIPAYPLDANATITYKSIKPVSEETEDVYYGIMFKNNIMQIGIYSDNMHFESNEFASHITIYLREFNKQTESWEIITMAAAEKYFKLTNITENSFTMGIYAMPGARPDIETTPVITDAPAIQTFNFEKVDLSI